MFEILLPRSPLHLLELLLVVYTGLQAWMVYFPDISLAQIHECLLHVDEEHCGDPDDWFRGGRRDESKFFQISDMAAKALIKKYADIESGIKPSEDCVVGFGYNTCKDIGFSSTALFKSLEPEIKQLTETKKGKTKLALVPTVHDEITDLQTFVETFLYYFSQGSNAEYVSKNKDLFLMMQQRLFDDKLEVNQEIGGHSAVWAMRSMIEGCKAYITPQPSNFSKKAFNNHRDASKLVFPIDLMTVEEEVNKPKNQDTHLVFEYKKGDTILGYTAPRSNRFYFVHDPNGSVLQQMTDYHMLLDQIDSKDKPYRHMFGGFQLLQKLEQEEAETLYQEMRDVWLDTKDSKGPEGQEHMYHVEFGHFSSIEHFSLFEKYAVRNADSLGLNEVELQTIVEFWNNELEDINEEKSTQPELGAVIKMTQELFKVAKTKELPLSRVHLHPYGSFLMCYDTAKWQEAETALIKSSMTLLKYCLRDNENNVPEGWELTEDVFRITQLPRKIDLGGIGKESIEVTQDSLVYGFDLNDQGIRCDLQFATRCEKLFKTAGMGDTISGTGFIYHLPK